MNKDYTTWKLMAGFILLLLMMIWSSSASGQTYTCDEDICVVEFNASWNSANNVAWINKLSDCETKRILIDKGSWQKDFSIVVTPTIIIFVNGEEEKRYQANIMMTMEATQEDIQGKIDEIMMDSF